MCTLQHTKEVQNPKAQGTLSVRATFWACLYLVFSVTSTVTGLPPQIHTMGTVWMLYWPYNRSDDMMVLG